MKQQKLINGFTKEQWKQGEDFVERIKNEVKPKQLIMGKGGKGETSYLTTKEGKSSSDSREPTTPNVHLLDWKKEFDKIKICPDPNNEKPYFMRLNWHEKQAVFNFIRFQKQSSYTQGINDTIKKVDNLLVELDRPNNLGIITIYNIRQQLKNLLI